MSLGAFLRTKSGEYELLAQWHAERASVDDQHFVACQAMLVVGIVLSEVAEAIDMEWGRRRARTEAFRAQRWGMTAPRPGLDAASARSWWAVFRNRTKSDNSGGIYALFAGAFVSTGRWLLRRGMQAAAHAAHPA